MARLIQQKEKFYPRSFTARYNVHKSVYYENFNSIVEAMERERFLKGKVRKFEIQLIESLNPTWRDLSYEVLTW
ncbi:MAG: GIY-YIG nuclease family protein [Cyclobacteriaceae bacterium]|jgi:putative endonuclease|nr:GIY-YIG nuclease family protein [Cyclobacteriaceae bacterium]